MALHAIERLRNYNDIGVSRMVGRRGYARIYNFPCTSSSQDTERLHIRGYESIKETVSCLYGVFTLAQTSEHP